MGMSEKASRGPGKKCPQTQANMGIKKSLESRTGTGGQTVWASGAKDHRTYKALGVGRWASFIYLSYVLRPTRDKQVNPTLFTLAQEELGPGEGHSQLVIRNSGGTNAPREVLEPPGAQGNLSALTVHHGVK